MNTLLLKIWIVLTLTALCLIHIGIKPEPSEREIGEAVKGMVNSTEWKGQFAPDFNLKTTNGEQFRLSDGIGKKVIVLNFFATWCGPCREEMPELNRYFNDHKGEPFLMVGVDAEEKQDRVDSFVSDLKVNFPVLIDDGSLEKRYGVSALPTTVVIGVDGKVQFYETGALVNADVAFGNLLQQNFQLLKTGRAITTDEYLAQAQKHPNLPSSEGDSADSSDGWKFDARGTRIVAKMDCTCGCDKKVGACTCNASTKIKKALSTEDFKNQSDEEIMSSLNKRFCMGAM